MISLERGKPYPLPTISEGASANFLVNSGNILQIVLHGMCGKEATALNSGTMKAGFLYHEGSLLWLFQFNGKNGKPVLSIDAPFDARLISDDLLNVPACEDIESRLLVNVHAVDERCILRGIRGITMPPALTVDFLSAACDQRARNEISDVPMQAWNQIEIPRLMRKTTMYVMGR